MCNGDYQRVKTDGGPFIIQCRKLVAAIEDRLQVTHVNLWTENAMNAESKAVNATLLYSTYQ